MERVYLETFGCQMNRLDSELVLGQLTEAGYEVTDDVNEADVVLFNTCSVRRHAEEKVLSRLGSLKQLKKRRPQLVIGVLGCMAQARTDEILKQAPHVDLVIGTRQLAEVLETVRRARVGGGPLVRTGETGHLREFLAGPRRRKHPFTAYVSIMRGCDNFCAYCVVPYVRGRETSRPPDEILRNVERLVADGVIEITLLGQNVNSYGKNLPDGMNLARLLERLDGIEGLRWIRFITSHPRDVDEALLATMARLPKVTEYLHFPAQSGSDRILAAMNRGYTRQGYLASVRRARELMPDIALAGDFIVGFPGETDEDFHQSASLLEEVRYHNCFIFKYSPRPGTAAARLPDDVPLAVKKERNWRLLETQRRISTEENARRVGRTFEVLVEGPSKRDPDRFTGRTRTNHIVIVGRHPELVGRIVPVRIAESSALALYGEVEGR